MSSPHITQAPSVGRLMRRVLLALIPTIVAYVYAFGTAILISLAIATLTAILTESLVLRLRRYPILPFLSDGSAVVTAWLLALALPPLSPWWLTVIGVAFALIIAKHLYGGLGNNLFNPAMVGFAVLLISFPAYITHWPAPITLAQVHLSVSSELRYIFSGVLPSGVHLDAINMATPLDTLRTELHRQLTVGEIMKLPIFTAIGGKGSVLVAFATLLGGLYLLFTRTISWHVPVAFLGGLFLIASAFYTGDPSRFAAPWFHLMAGGAILGAFFIATDPVSGATTPRGKLIFGLGIGLLTYIIRALGGYPDGVAFAVLLMNAAVPLIDAYTQPPVFGQKDGTR